MDPEDVVHSRTILLWGSNTLTSNQHLWPFVEQARADGAHVVVIDPVRHRTAERADEHVALRVGTDAALALGLCHVIAKDGIDRAFLAAQHPAAGTSSRHRSRDTRPIGVAAICDVPAEQIIEPRPAHRDQRAHGDQARPGHAASATRRPGGAGRLVHPGAHRRLPPPRRRPRLQHGRRLRAQLVQVSRTATCGRGSRAHAGDDPPRAAICSAPTRRAGLFVMGANPVVSNPAQGAVREQLTPRRPVHRGVRRVPDRHRRLRRLSVLPSTLQTEHVEVMDSFGHLYLNWNEPAVAPPGECVSKTELMRRLAAAMGLTEPALFATDHELADDLLDTPTWRDAGIGVDELRAAGWLRIPGTDRVPPFADGFPTASGRFEFASDARQSATATAGCPNYRAADEEAAADDEPARSP